MTPTFGLKADNQYLLYIRILGLGVHLGPWGFVEVFACYRDGAMPTLRGQGTWGLLHLPFLNPAP